MTKSFVDEIMLQRLKYHKRNFICLMLESFCFAFALSIFSIETVFPIYVENLSNNTIFIALLAVLFYGVSYTSTVFSSVIGLNARSPKWISVFICFFQRLGFILIFLSTYLVNINTSLALITFFISLALYSTSSGLSNPLFAQMISTTIPRNVGNFYGMYMMVGAVSGIIASFTIVRVMEFYSFPENFRNLFLFGVMTSLIATAVVAVGVKEIIGNRVSENITLKESLAISIGILRTDLQFRNFAYLKVLSAAAEVAIPYYVVNASMLQGVTVAFVGQMTGVFLMSKMIASFVLGKLADRFGAKFVMAISCVCGALAALISIVNTIHYISYVMYSLLSIAIAGILMATNVACLSYSKGYRTPAYAATLGMLCAPIYIIISFGGAAIANVFSFNAIFIGSFILYCICAVMAFRYRKTVEVKK